MQDAVGRAAPHSCAMLSSTICCRRADCGDSAGSGSSAETIVSTSAPVRGRSSGRRTSSRWQCGRPADELHSWPAYYGNACQLYAFLLLLIGMQPVTHMRIAGQSTSQDAAVILGRRISHC